MTPLNPLNVVEAALANVHGWLAPWFDGDTHTLDGVSRVFPRARWAFNEGPARQPRWQAGEAEPQVEIRVIPAPGHTQRWGEEGGQRWFCQQRWAFWVSASHPEAGASAEAAQAAALCLFALLASPGAALELNASGVTHWQPELPVAVPSVTGAARLVPAGVTLTWWTPGA